MHLCAELHEAQRSAAAVLAACSPHVMLADGAPLAVEAKVTLAAVFADERGPPVRALLAAHALAVGIESS